MSATSSPSRSLDALLWHHFNWHLWTGLAIWIGCAGPFLLHQYWQKRLQVLAEPFYADHRGAALADVAAEFTGLGSMLLLSAFAIALIGSCLRYPFLGALSRRARTRSGLVVKSLLLFELQVVILSLPPWPIAYNRFGIESISHQLVVIFLFSLPWLVTTGLASWRLGATLFSAAKPAILS